MKRKISAGVPSLENLHRFFVRAECVSEGQVTIDGPDARQICCVLRLGRGDFVAALDGAGCANIVRIAEVNPTRVVGDVVEVCPLNTEPCTKLTIAQSLPKADKLEFLIQKGTELGVVKFEIISTARTVARPPDGRGGARLVRWQTIAKEAAEQSCRAVVPEVCGISALEEFVPRIANYDLAICLWEEERRRSIRQVLKDNSSAENVLMIIGPEGGLERREVSLLEENGAISASLGKRVLRCETAGIAAAAVAFYELEM
ncbi:MAG: 16S rRNA (uracil(1498)-N(3))-methyltransferase [Armatimonadetes bacterium]|nr:16S rRNA (uracil(1498)-N(3))-methyltransferase [Armatimonadota bacterium]